MKNLSEYFSNNLIRVLIVTVLVLIILSLGINLLDEIFDDLFF
ncbi:MAG: hypothetical protein ACRCVW_04020 [Brevinema sp.]